MLVKGWSDTRLFKYKKVNCDHTLKCQTKAYAANTPAYHSKSKVTKLVKSWSDKYSSLLLEKWKKVYETGHRKP